MINESGLELKNESISEIEIYFDEIEPDEKNCNYLILGALFLETNNKSKILNRLLNYRCLNDKNIKWSKEYTTCPNKEYCREKWHKQNNTEIHFVEIRNGSSSSQIKIAKRLIELYKVEKSLKMAILYIDLKKLDKSLFNDSNANIYNKFFRTIINYGLKCFYNLNNKIQIKNIFYDKKEELERHSFFKDYNFDKLKYETNDNVELLGKILFIESDHKSEGKYSDESNFIQLVDLMLGIIRQNIFYVSKDKIKCDVARTLRKELNDLQENRHSHNRLKISFFPKNGLKSVVDLDNKISTERKDEFLSLEEFKLNMPAQEADLSRWF